MLDQIGWQAADTVLSPLVPEMVLGTRYDKLPYMCKFLRAWGEAQPDLESMAGDAGRTGRPSGWPGSTSSLTWTTPTSGAGWTLPTH